MEYHRGNMKKKNKTTVISILISVVIIILIMAMVDMMHITNEIKRRNNTIDESIQIYFNNSRSVDLLKYNMSKNNIDNDYSINTENNTIEIIYDESLSSIFGHIIGINNYAIHIDRVGVSSSGSIKITKKE